MKRVICTLSLICFGSWYLPIMAQLHKGQAFFGGSLSFYNSNDKSSYGQKSSSNNLGITFEGGRFFKDKTAYLLGVNLYSNSNSGYSYIYTQVDTRPDGEALYINQQADTKTIYTSTDVYMGLNRYILLKERLAVILSGNFLASFQHNEYTEQITGQDEQVSIWKNHNFSLNFKPGLIYFLSPRFGVSGYLGGLSLQYAPKTAYNYSSSISGNFSTSGVLSLGLNYFFK